MTYYVYILLSLKDGKFYIGFTDKLERRLKEHKDGKVDSTKNRRPVRLIFYEAFSHRADAWRREQYFKTTKGKKTLRLVLRETLQKYL